MKKIAIIIIIIAICTAFLLGKSNEVYFKFDIDNSTNIAKISRLISIDDLMGNTVFAYANESDLQKLRSLGFLIEILPKQNRNFSPRMADSIEEMREWDSYPTYETYVDIMYQFAQNHPNICTVFSVGQSVEGRELITAKITDNPSIEENEPEFFYTGQMHGDELVSFILLLHLIDYLLENYGSDDRVTNIVNNIEIYINPLSNPDGTYAGGNDTVWEATRFNSNSVDLNRNFPDPEDGVHPDGNEHQPENIAMMEFADQHNFVLSSNLHSGAEVVNYPWDTWAQLAADDDWWQDVAHTYADAAHENAPANYMNDFDNGITNGFAWYSISGGRQDYMNYFHHCREVTLELADEKFLAEDELSDHWNYNMESLLLYLEECLYGIRGIVTDEAGNPLRAKVKAIGHDFDNSEVYSDEEIGNYHRMLASGSYDLEFSAFGYLAETIENIQIIDNDIIQQNVSLAAAPQIDVSGIVLDAETGDPIADAELEILETPFDIVLSNTNGEFTFANVPYGNYSIIVTADGYSVYSEDIIVDQDSNFFEFNLLLGEIESFETADFSSFNWYFEGNSDWLIASDNSFDGIYSARSGAVNNQSASILKLDLEVTYAGTISFYRKVSSEASYDFLCFYIDNEQVGQWSGEINWEMVSYPVTAGQHTFTWCYEKDNSVANGDDCGWIDYITFPPLTELEVGNQLPQMNIELLDNYPNPFNPTTTILFTISNYTCNAEIKIDIYNVKGQLVKTFPNLKIDDSPIQQVIWNGIDDLGKDVSSGIYFYSLKIDNTIIDSKKMIMIK